MIATISEFSSYSTESSPRSVYLCNYLWRWNDGGKSHTHDQGVPSLYPFGLYERLLTINRKIFISHRNVNFRTLPSSSINDSKISKRLIRRYMCEIVINIRVYINNTEIRNGLNIK